MIIYWLTIIRMLLLRPFRSKVAFDQRIEKTYRVGLLDCDGLRVMTAWKYPMYMDFIRFEMTARSKLFEVLFKHGLAPSLGSQKLIYRKPLKRWTTFTLSLECAGWDDKWMYHIHRFVQNDQTMAIGITRALIWKKDKPATMQYIMEQLGNTEVRTPPNWVLDLYKTDKAIVEGTV
jgi:hypothetical protein